MMPSNWNALTAAMLLKQRMAKEETPLSTDSKENTNPSLLSMFTRQTGIYLPSFLST